METPAAVIHPQYPIPIHNHHHSSPPSPTICRDQAAATISDLLRRSPNLHLHHVKQIQAQLFRRHLHHDNVLATKLVSSCSSSGAMNYASRLYLALPSPDLVLCNAMLKGYTLNSLHASAFRFFLDRVLLRGFRPDSFTLPYVLKACGALGSSAAGRQVHAVVVKRGDLCRDAFVMNSVVDMYFKCGARECASRAFRAIENPDSSAWNVVVAGLLSVGNLVAARALFDDMPERDVVSWNTMLSAYARAGQMGSAQSLFDEMPEKNLVSWNALIVGYSQNGRNDQALVVFSQMTSSGVEPDGSTILAVTSACRSLNLLLPDDEQIVDQISYYARGMNSVSVSTSLLCLHARIGRLEEARKLFDEIPEKDLVAWNAMIGGYSQNQRPAEAIELFRLMQEQRGVKPDGVTMASLVDSCSQTGALGLGEWIHAYVRKNRIEVDTFLATALIDMYAKCGDLDRSRALFSTLRVRDLASWNAMIKGLAIHGCGVEVLEAFSAMEAEEEEDMVVAPNEITFIGLLSACSHGGLVDEGLELFDAMQSRYGIAPRIEHYGCVVDLLARAGRLAEAFEVARTMPVRPDSILWGSLLSACRSHRNVELAEEAAGELLALDPGHDGNYVLLSNAYASAGQWERVEEIRARMRAGEVRKEPGRSAVELDGVIHEFKAGDRSHPRTEEIYGAWDELLEELKAVGYVPDTTALLKNVGEGEKEEALYRHSEKLALSLALISAGDGKTPIRIVKNLRICSDCHRAMELVSLLKGRDIVVRDRNRFHRFRGGACSCGGYW